MFDGAGDGRQYKKARAVLRDRRKGIRPSLKRIIARIYLLAEDTATKILFRGKRIQSSGGRVSSVGEKLILEYFIAHGIAYAYEDEVEHRGITLKPDFFLPEHNVYVEHWGKADLDRDYRANVARKMALYSEKGETVVSLYPRHVKDIESLEKGFPKAFEKATGRPFQTSERR